MWKHKNFINLQLCAGETWVLNETVDIPTTTQTYQINFTSNNTTFSTFHLIYESKFSQGINYDSTFVYITGLWQRDAYRTVTFATPPTGDLLTWLQANGTKQSAPTPTLTFKHFYDAGTIGSGTVKFRHYSQQEPSAGGEVTLSVQDFNDVSKVSGDFVGTLTVSTANNNGNKIVCGAKGYEWLPKFEDGSNPATIVAEICTAFGVTQDSEGNTIDTSKWEPVTGFWVRVTNNGLDGGSCILTFNYANALSEEPASKVRLLVYNADLDTLQIDTVASIEQINGVITTKYAYGFNQVICIILGSQAVQAGTYQFNEELTSAYFSHDVQVLNFTSNSQSCYAIGLDAEDIGSPIDTIRYGIEGETNFIGVYQSNGGWTNASYKTIIVETDQIVSYDFYTWFTANTTKLS